MDQETYEKNLKRVLEEAGYKDSNNINFEWYMNEYRQYSTPVLEKAVFMREAWGPIISGKNSDWIDDWIDVFQTRADQENNLYIVRFEPENTELLDALKQFKESSLTPEALTTIVRNAQLDVLANFAFMLDGGSVYENGIEADWALCGLDDDANPDPDKVFGNIQELIWDFDPDRKDV